MARFGSHTMARVYIALLSLAMLLFFSSCKDDEPKADENLVEAYVDIRVMEQSLGTESPESRLARRDILSKHGFTLESFKASIDVVLDDRNLWVPFQKAVVARIDTLLHVPPPPTADPKAVQGGVKK